MARIGIVTCETILPYAQSQKSPLFTHDDILLIDELKQRGHEVVPVVWRKQLPQSGEWDLLLQRSPWDYSLHHASYLQWLEKAVSVGIAVHNSYEITRWNSDKHYLRDLEQRGVIIVPTLFVSPEQSVVFSDIMCEQGWEDMVVKPAISAAARDTFRIHRSQAETIQTTWEQIRNHRTFMFQPFVQEVLSEGEWSFTFLGGQYSHALRKRAKAGDYRVQDDHGGKVFADTPQGCLVEQAHLIHARLDPNLLYARVDGIDVNGTLWLVELELIEPELFLRIDPQAPSRFADAIENHLR